MIPQGVGDASSRMGEMVGLRVFTREEYAEVKLAAKFLRTILLNIKGFEISLEESEKHLSKLRLQYF